MKKTFTVIISFLLLSNLNAQWINSEFPLDKDLNRIFYTSDKKLWGYGGSPNIYLLNSYDGGNSYTFNNITFRTISSFSPITDKTAFLIGSTASIGTSIFKSDDGGATWSALSKTPDSIFYNSTPSLIVFDSVNLCLFSRRLSNSCNEIYTSNDAGLNWVRSSCDSLVGIPNQLDRIPNLVSKIGNKAVITLGDCIYKLHNNGTSCKIEPYLTKFTYLTFIDSINVVGFKTYTKIPYDYSTIHFSSNGGADWDSLPQTFKDIVTISFAKSFDKDKSGYLIAGTSQGAIYSSDKGRTWKNFDYSPHKFLTFYDRNNGLSYSPRNNGGLGLRLFTGEFLNINRSPSPLAISVFPNPTQNILNINIEDDILKKTIGIQVVSVNGQVFNLLGINKTIDISYLKQGVYCLVINSEKGVYKINFVKE